MLDDVVSKRIKDVLKDLGIKQSFLASRLGVTPQGLSKMLSAGGIGKSKYLSRIADALDVTEDYLITGNDKPVLLVNDDQLKRLINTKFELLEDDKSQIKDLMIESTHTSLLFAYKLKISIDNFFRSGSLLVFSSDPPNLKVPGKIYILLSNIGQSFIIGKCSDDKQNLINLNGHYLIHPNDQLIGCATQITLYLETND